MMLLIIKRIKKNKFRLEFKFFANTQVLNVVTGKFLLSSIYSICQL